VSQNSNVAVEFRLAHPVAHILGFLICSAVAAGSWLAMESVWLAVPLLGLGLWLSVGRVTRIDVKGESVVQVKRLLQVVPISTTMFPLSDFVAVQVRLSPANSDDSESEGQWTVGLKPRKGKVLDVMWFSEIRRQEPSEEVEGRIQELARVTRLPIERVGET